MSVPISRVANRLSGCPRGNPPSCPAPPVPLLSPKASRAALSYASRTTRCYNSYMARLAKPLLIGLLTLNATGCAFLWAASHQLELIVYDAGSDVTCHMYDGRIATVWPRLTNGPFIAQMVPPGTSYWGTPSLSFDARRLGLPFWFPTLLFASWPLWQCWGHVKERWKVTPSTASHGTKP